MRKLAYAVAVAFVGAVAIVAILRTGDSPQEPSWLDRERRHEQSAGTIVFSPDEVRVDRVVRPGRIKWLERREPRGEPVEWPVSEEVDFARLVRPDPRLPLRVALGVREEGFCLAPLAASDEPRDATRICTRKFSDGWPALFVFAVGYGGGAPVSVGIVSDVVARIELQTPRGATRPVRVRDNVLAVRQPGASSLTPGKLIAYDKRGRSVAVEFVR